MSEYFTRKTFQYFEEAGSNSQNIKWFEKNKEVYEEHVKEPFSFLIKKIDLSIGKSFPGIPILPRKILNPLEDGLIVRNKTSAFLSEKSASKFEWNPGIYLTMGSEKCFMGHGLYRPSSRQMKLLRPAIMKSSDQFTRIVKNKKFTETWGELSGEKFIRFPKEYEPEKKGAEYLWHKRLYFEKVLTRKTVLDRNFAETVIHDFRLAAPYIGWIRETVGIYVRDEAG